ncbi:MAG: InlB B-repeat-containing protein [Treponema sp.]|jgi:hypothetical protein|nr:InlB B-repeat-containing protein [Treponema sp.]
MKKLPFCTLVILGLIFLGCDNSTENTDTGSGSYTVTFTTYASGTIPAQTVSPGGKVSAASTPTGDPAGAQFAGWYKNGGIDTWNFSDPVTENMTLCAGWKFTTIAALTTFLDTVTAGDSPAARHTIQGVDPNPGKLPIPVAVQIQLTRQNWADLVTGIESKNKKVSLDLRDCTKGTGGLTEGNAAAQQEGGLWADGTFNPLDAAAGYLPNPGTSRVNNTIAGLVLPEAATKLYQATTNLNLCKEIRGNEVTEITTNNSFHGGLMAKVYFPKLTAIGDALKEAQNLEVAYLSEVTEIADEAFMWTWKAPAPGVYNVYIPKVEKIGNKAFAQSGPGDLTITLGATPPTLGTRVFEGVTGTKRITVRVPSASQSAYTEAWVEGLKGKGWTSSGPGNGAIMRNINVTIEGY